MRLHGSFFSLPTFCYLCAFWLVMSIVLCLGLGLNTDGSKRSIFLMQIENKRLVSTHSSGEHGLPVSKKIVYAGDVMGCTSACLREDWCRSLNVRLNLAKNERILCELLSVDRFNLSKYLISDKEFSHYGKMPCADSPCINGACASSYHEPYFQCTCLPGYTGQTCATASSCSVIRSTSPLSPSGIYSIDPDGSEGEPAFNVYCNMTDKGGVGVTVISHDSEARTYVHDDVQVPGSYSRPVTYQGASWKQLAKLTEFSIHCEQYIRWECHNAMFLEEGYAWWVSRDNANMTYWGGATPGSHNCSCGMTSSCASPSKGCNCDSNDGVLRSDEGLLTDKTALPVREMRFGDFNDANEYGYHTLGKMKCYGIPSAMSSL